MNKRTSKLLCKYSKKVGLSSSAVKALYKGQPKDVQEMMRKDAKRHLNP